MEEGKERQFVFPVSERERERKGERERERDRKGDGKMIEASKAFFLFSAMSIALISQTSEWEKLSL